MHLGIYLGNPDLHGYLRRYKVTDEDLYAWYENEYWYATRNPVGLAYRKSYLSFDEFQRLPYRAFPLRYGLGTTEADGASAVVLNTREFTKRSDTLISLEAVSHKEESSYYPHSQCEGPTKTDFSMMHAKSLSAAWKEAFSIARVSPEQLDVYQAHDAILSICYSHLDSLGHPRIPVGYAPKWFTEGQTKPGGDLPVGTSGCAKSGYTPGADALDYVIENVHQLREEAGERQCPMKNYLAAFSVSPLRPAVGILWRQT